MASNKENMRQAMKELLGLVGMSKEEEKAEEVSPAVEADLESTRQEVAKTVEEGFFRQTSAPQTPPPVRDVPQEVPSEAPKTAESGFFDMDRAFSIPAAPKMEFGSPAAPEGEPEVHAPFIRPSATVIAAGTSFFGDLRAEGDVEVLGKLKGNLEATGNVRITGKVLGDVKGAAVALRGCAVQGNITSTSFVTLDESAMVVGDILATDLESDGKIKGNLQIARAASFLPAAVLAGNVTASTITMSQGARVQGTVRIAEDPETNALFGDGLEI